jgi:hypothetical protein
MDLLNQRLRRDIPEILNNGTTIKKGVLSGYSIDLIDNPLTYTSYCYYNESKRDSDFDELEKIIDNSANHLENKKL